LFCENFTAVKLFLILLKLKNLFILDNGRSVFLFALKYRDYSNSIILLYANFVSFRDLCFLWLFQKVVKNLPQVEQMLRFVVLSL